MVSFLTACFPSGSPIFTLALSVLPSSLNSIYVLLKDNSSSKAHVLTQPQNQFWSSLYYLQATGHTFGCPYLSHFHRRMGLTVIRPRGNLQKCVQKGSYSESKQSGKSGLSLSYLVVSDVL